MDTMLVTTPKGRQFRVRISNILKVESTYDTWTGRRYFLRRMEVNRESATAVFDALQPELFEKK